MSLDIITGIIPSAQFGMFYGEPSVGKTTLAKQCPNPLIFDLEDGSRHLNVARILIANLSELQIATQRLPDTDYQTAVFDSLDRIDSWLVRKVCQEKSWKSLISPGWGKGEKALAEESERWIEETINPLVDAGVHVIGTSHALVKRYQEPGLDAVDHWTPHLHDAFIMQLFERCDFVLFLKFKNRVIDAEEGRPKAAGGQERVILTQYSAAADAKSRIAIAPELPCTYAAIEPLFCGWQRLPKIDPYLAFIEATSDLDPKQLRAFLTEKQKMTNGDVSPEFAREIMRGGWVEEFKQTVRDFDYLPME
jgi:hypothetical protein